MKPVLTLFSIAIIFFAGMAYANPAWDKWISELKQQAVSEGINSDVFDEAFATISAPDTKVQHLNNHQPEHRLTYDEYKESRVDSYKIMIGRREYQKNIASLESVSRDFNVNACYIAALWGMETSYGRYTGKFPVIKSLATLAYQSSRKTHFRKELMYALHMLNQHQVSLDQFKGEWAGATGQPQFLPSSWFQYAVDYDDCGRKDIWTSYTDVFASISNYMVKNNWRNDEPVMVEVELPDDFDLGLIGKTITKPVKEWNELGVSTSRGGKLPFPELSASVIQPDGGETFLIYPNFKVLLTYNNSIYYAGTVDYLAHAICSNAP
jgi:membrane-bound lytic murein transglycosylase B